MSEELKPCPFCGAEVKKEGDGVFHPVVHVSCFLSGLFYKTVYAWNTRSLEDALSNELGRTEDINAERLHDMAQLMRERNNSIADYSLSQKIVTSLLADIHAEKVKVSTMLESEKKLVIEFSEYKRQSEYERDALQAENERMRKALEEWMEAVEHDVFAPCKNGNEAQGTDEGEYYNSLIMRDLVKNTREALKGGDE